MMRGLGMSPEPFADQAGGVFDLAVQLQQLAGQPGNQHSSGCLAWQLDSLGSGRSHRAGGHLSHLPGRRPVLTQEPAQPAGPASRMAPGV